VVILDQNLPIALLQQKQWFHIFLGSYRAYLDTCTSWSSIKDHTQVFLCFGGIPIKNGQISQGGTGHHYQQENLKDASKSGIEFINISPLKSDFIDEVKSEWVAARPNTDTALMLGIAHTLHVEGLSNKEFLKKYTEGFEKFLPYLLGEIDGIKKDASWAAEICNIPPEKIKELAYKLSSKRSMISVSWSLTRQDHGEQPFWMAIMLASMIGQIGLPGGGFGFGYSATNFIGGQFTILPGAAFPQTKNEIENFIPVARISDLLLHPGKNLTSMEKVMNIQIQKLFIGQVEILFITIKILNRLIKAWEKPDTIISNEWCWNTLAKRSDIVLPCTTPLERNDIMMTPRDPYVVSMSKLIEPYKQARDDYEIFSNIAKRMGVEDKFTEGKKPRRMAKMDIF
jgi:biotin/methionine sulfoxide reductase